MISERESFCAVLYNGSLLRSDAIVVLAGEDGEQRLNFGCGLMFQNGGQFLVISGGVDEPPKRVSAKTLHPKALGYGVAPDKIILETESRNTKEQAVNVVNLAKEREWARITLVASPQHIPRAFLTFVRALQNAEVSDRIQVCVAPASHLPWFKSPPGVERTRLQLLAGEWGKVALYGDDVATYAEGLAYLESWEGR